MSYPFVGIQGVFPDYEKWDAAAIERALRDGRHIYLEDGIGSMIVVFESGEFRVGPVFPGEILFRSPDFIELAAWVAFTGRDIL